MEFKTSTPKHVQVREELRKKIVSGELAPGMRLPSETELLKILTASDTTVVRALNELVREGLIVRRRGSGTFVAEQTHPPLIPGRNLKLGILWLHSVVPGHTGNFSHRVSLGALDAWGVQGVQPELEADRAGTFTRATFSQPARGLVVEFLGNELDGLNRAPSLEVVAKAGYDAVMTVGIIEEKWLDGLLELGLPTTIVDFPTQRHGKKADLVYADPQHGYRDAVVHFLSRGLKRIHFAGALIRDPEHRTPDASMNYGVRFGRRVDPDSYLRLSAYRQAMEVHGLRVPEQWVHFEPNSGLEAFAARLAALPEADRPQAVLCHGTEHAEPLIGHCAARGLALEAAGGDSQPHFGRALNILLDAHEMGAVAAEHLLARLLRPARPYLNVGVRMVFAPESAGQAAAVSHSKSVLANP
ncbi:MAG: GntR family transcriptional regulator [Planctomycetes bacterium]|nr:GntR family transcriptional regulator [Planctomycetota bacterium]